MPTSAAFNNPWYAEKIEQSLHDDEYAGVSRAIMVAGAFIAEAITDSLGPNRNEETVMHVIDGIAISLSEISDAIKDLTPPS